MGPHEWEESTDLEAMFVALRGRVSPSQALLIACTFCRLLWDRLEGESVIGRGVIEAAERFARGEGPYADLEQPVPAFDTALSRCYREKRGRRNPLEPIRSLFSPYGGSEAGMRWTTKAIRKALPQKK